MPQRPPSRLFFQPRSRVTAWLFLGGCSPCFMVSATLAIFQCRTLITNYGFQSWVLNDPRNVTGDRDRVISQFLVPSLTVREEWYHSIQGVSIQQETWWPFLVPDKRSSLPFCENANSKRLPYKSRFLWDGPSMSNRGRSKAPVASEVGCLIGPQCEVLCVCVALALFAWYLQQSVTFWLEMVCGNQMQNSLLQSVFEIRNK